MGSTVSACVSVHDSESIAAGQKWAEDAERDLEHDEWRLQRAASAAWEMEVEPLLTSAYQEVEAVAGAADVLTEHIMRKSSTEVDCWGICWGASTTLV